MDKMYTFHQTVVGRLHVKRGLPCQDCSDSFSAPDGRYHIAVVADGHGDSKCFRSAAGSRIAVETAMEDLRALAEQITQSPEAEQTYCSQVLVSDRDRAAALRQLTDTILAQWTGRVIEHFNTTPPVREELPEDKRDKFDDYMSRCWEDAGKPHLYGTTLMAALMLEDRFLLLIHQGDGRCDVFYEDGTIDQPIPWDKRCEGNVTTSMCDKDAAESFRSCVLDLNKKPVMACYLGCDGVEDSYRDTYDDCGGTHCLMGGVHTFYKGLSCKLATLPAEQFEEYLREALPKFSEKGLYGPSGSGDDVSVAGIVDVQALKKWVDVYELDARRYTLEEQLFWREDDVRGMTRKHGILQRRFSEAAAKIDDVRLQIKEQEAKIDDKRSQLEQLRVQAAKARQEMQAEIAEGDQVIADKPSLLIKLLGWSDTDPDTFSQGVSRRRKKLADHCSQLEDKAAACEKQLDQLCGEKDALDKALDETIAAAEEARKNYEEYHARFENARQLIDDVKAELDALPDSPAPEAAEPETAEA